MHLINIFKTKIDELEKFFINANKDFFFTEKEIHSYLYHLCTSDENNFIKNGLSLVHAEYPTPFKCSMGKEFSDFKVVKDTDKNMRSHIDMVLLNPHFIDWICKTRSLEYTPIEYIKGITNKLFSKYIKEMRQQYDSFIKATAEKPLLAAIEFKYLRADYEGEKTPLNAIKQDIEKMKEMRHTNYVSLSKCIVFVHRDKIKVFESLSSNRDLQAQITDDFLSIVYK